MLPDNKKDFYEIRLESIGGLGANLAGKLLGELGALYLDFNSQSFASYGSEKRGSPVKSYIRYAPSNKEIRLNCPIEKPDLVALFSIGIAGKENSMAGVGEGTAVVVNSPAKDEKELDKLRQRLQMSCGTLYTVDALKIAIKEKSRINMVMLGAIAKASGFIPLEKLEEIITNTMGKKYPKALEGNINAVRSGYNSTYSKHYEFDRCYPLSEYKETQRLWGYDNSPLGGINPVFGSTISNNVGFSREGYVPIFHKERCINCGLCDTTCPDMSFQFTEGEYKGKKAYVNIGIDYYHCKGCLRCIEICPVEALTSATEADVDIEKLNIGNIHLKTKDFLFDDVGSNSWMESESQANNEK